VGAFPIGFAEKIVHRPEGEKWTKNYLMGTLASKTGVPSLDYGNQNFNQTFQKVNKQEEPFKILITRMIKSSHSTVHVEQRGSITLWMLPHYSIYAEGKCNTLYFYHTIEVWNYH
jgi:hypothetical protein